MASTGAIETVTDDLLRNYSILEREIEFPDALAFAIQTLPVYEAI